MKNTVGERVKLLRSTLNLTQTDFAQKINSTFATISRIENETTNPRKSLLIEICRVFGVNQDWIFKGDGEMMLPGFVANNVSEPRNWKEEAYSALKDHNDDLKKEVEWLRGILSKTVGVNFHNGIDLALGLFPVNTVSAVA